jgi:uncharacterized membrane protein YkoI
MNAVDHIPMEIKCNIEGDLEQIILVFSNDNGVTWYEIEMQKNGNVYSLTIPSVKIGSKVLYVFKGYGPNGEEFMEDNQGQFYSQVAIPPEPIKGVDSSFQSSLTSETLNSPLTTSSPESDISDESSQFNQQESIESDLNTATDSVLPDNNSIIPQKIENDSDNSEPTQKIQESRNNVIDQESATAKIVPKQKLRALETPVVHFADPYNHFAQETPKEVVQPKTECVVDESVSDHQSDRVITAFNPYSLEDGQIGAPPTVAETFSRIMGAKRTNSPEKKQSFVNKPENQDAKVCGGCKANLNLTWKICPVCGAKVK